LIKDKEEEVKVCSLAVESNLIEDLFSNLNSIGCNILMFKIDTLFV